MGMPIVPRWIKGFSEIYLSPAERLSEIMFGLIMVLTVTSTMKIVLTNGETETRIMMFAALGSNAAWGIVDGVMYVLTSVFERNRYARLVSCIRTAPDENSALSVIEEELEPTVISMLDEKEKRRIYIEILKGTSQATLQEARVTKDDISGAFSCFLLVFFSAFPVVVPFFILQDLRIAIRVSNLVAIMMLFAIGYEWAKYTNKNRLKAGIAMVLIGSTIVALTVVLGG